MELTRYQKLLLAVLAGMLIVFGALLAALRARPGVLFEEGLLKIEEQEGRTVYSGRANGTMVTISVTHPTDILAVADFAIGREIHDVFEVEYPLAPVVTEEGDTVDGVRVTKNGEEIFRGGCDPEGPFGASFYDADGNWDPSFGVRVYTTGGSYWDSYETDAYAAVRFALGPEADAARGDPLVFAMAAIISAVLAVDIVFHKQLFRWRHMWARDPEPSESYLTFERAVWAVCAAVIAVIYIVSMVRIY